MGNSASVSFKKGFNDFYQKKKGFNDLDFSDRVLLLQITDDGGYDSQEFVSNFKLKTYNIYSLSLARESPFFYKLFNNGMRDSLKKDEFMLTINASEEAAFMDMLSFIYGGPLNATSRSKLVEVLMVADKFQVNSCIKKCIQLLLKLPMTVESALYYLEIPSVVFMGDLARPLIDAAKQHLSSRFRGLNKWQQKEAMSLPLCAIEAAVGDDGEFKVKSEDALLDFMLKWARKNYPDLEERRDILTNRLLGLICLPCLSSLKLKEMVDCPEFDSARVGKLACNSLFCKIEFPHGPNSIPTLNEAALLSNNALSKCTFPRRIYNRRRVIFFDIKKQDCAALTAMSPRIYSEAFYLGGRRFSLLAHRYKRNGSPNEESLGLYVEMGGFGKCSLNFEFSVMEKPSYEFKRLHTGNDVKYTYTRKTKGWMDSFKMPLTRLMSDDDNDYIIDGVIHIRAQVALNN